MNAKEVQEKKNEVGAKKVKAFVPTQEQRSKLLGSIPAECLNGGSKCCYTACTRCQ